MRYRASMTLDVNMFWHGPRLGLVHAACLRSFQRHGHRVVLHCYEPPKDLPDGVDLFDAADIMPLEGLLRNKETDSVALGADRYRYRMIAAGHGLYADCDMFCLRPISDAPYIFGKEQDNMVNCAFLKFPSNSDLAKALLAATHDPYFIPPWFKHHKQVKLKLKKKFGRPVQVGRHPWGVWGPQLLTYLVEKLGHLDKAAAIDRFYPVHPWQTSLLHDPGLRLSDIVTPRTEAVHLWHKMSAAKSPVRGSPLWEIINQD
jgi:hypothetical protein